MEIGREKRKGSVKQAAGSGNGEAGRRKRRDGCGWLFGVTAGAVLFCIGAARGELTVIWQKAVMICMECIGIG